MALPTTPFDVSTIINPSATLTNFSLMVDLAELSAEWKTLFDSSDEKKGYATDGDGNQLSCDYIDLDHTANTGWVRVRWDGDLLSTGVQQVRLYPPNAANDSVLKASAFGAYSVYASEQVTYWNEMGGTDRTDSAMNGTISGSPVQDAVGKVGYATTYVKATSSLVTLPTGQPAGDLSSVSAYSFSVWVKDTSPVGFNSAADGGYFCNVAFPEYQFIFGRYRSGVPYMVLYDPGRVGGDSLTSTTLINDSAWHHLVFNKTATDMEIWIDGVLDATVSSTHVITAASTNAPKLGIDGLSGYFGGTLDEGQFFKTARSAAWIAQEYAQTNNNATAWGTWTHVLPDSGSSPSSRESSRERGVSRLR